MPDERTYNEGVAHGARSSQTDVARTVLSTHADALEASCLRLRSTPDAVSALNEAVAILRDAADTFSTTDPDEAAALVPDPGAAGGEVEEEEPEPEPEREPTPAELKAAANG